MTTLPLVPNYSNIPIELRTRRQWACTALPEKKPVQINGQNASSTNPKTWNDFDACYHAACRKGWGVAFLFSPQDPYGVVDLDHVRDTGTGVTEPWAVALINEINSYTERSLSGAGWHIVVSGLLGAGRKRGRVELYDRAKAMTLTGDVQPGIGVATIRDFDLKTLESRLTSLDPCQVATPGTSQRPHKRLSHGGKSASEEDFIRIALVYRSVGRVKDADLIEREFQRMFPSDYSTRNSEKGPRAGVAYIRYSINNFLRRTR